MNSMKNKILPIGSIIEAKKSKLMICGYNLNHKPIQGHDYDYICCVYPNGVGPNSYLIQKKEIDNILFIGFMDDRIDKVKELMEDKK